MPRLALLLFSSLLPTNKLWDKINFHTRSHYLQYVVMLAAWPFHVVTFL